MNSKVKTISPRGTVLQTTRMEGWVSGAALWQTERNLFWSEVKRICFTSGSVLAERMARWGKFQT